MRLSPNSSDNNKDEETEMERIARLGREFREQEAARIAQEKEAAQLLAQQRKQDELQKIALAKGLTLEEAAKEMERQSKERRSILAMSKEDQTIIDSHVSEKARLLSKRDKEQKKRLEEDSSITPSQSTTKFGRSSFGNNERKSSSSSSSSPLGTTTNSDNNNKTFLSGSPSSEKNNLEDGNNNNNNGDNGNNNNNNNNNNNGQGNIWETLEDAKKQPKDIRTKLDANRTKEEQSPSSDNNNTASIQEDENEDDDTFFDAPMTTTTDKEELPPVSTKKAGLAQQKTTTTTTTILNDVNDVESERKASEQLSNDDDRSTRSSINRLQSQESSEFFDSISSQPSNDNIDVSRSTNKSSTKDTARSLQNENDDKYMQSLVIRRRDHQTFGSSSQRRKKRKGSNIAGDESDGGGGGNNMYDVGGRKEATVEFPIEYNKSDGTFEVLRETNINMSVYVPPSKVQGRWSGMLEGHSTLGGIGEGGRSIKTNNKKNYNNATGSITLNYNASSWSRLTMGLVRGHELFHPMITLGGSILKDGSNMGISFYHNASFLHAMMLEHSMFALSFRHHFHKSKWIVSSSLSRKQQLSVAVTNSKVSVSVGSNLRRPGDQLNIRFDARPKFSDDRRGHLYCQCQLGRGIWQIGACFVQSLHSQVATVGLGVRVLSTRGMEWIISWNRGNATMKIPLLITRGLQNVSVAEIVYFTFLSLLIEEGIADLWGWKSSSSVNNEQEASKSNPTIEDGGVSLSSSSLKKKSQTNAELQRNLMERQAKRKKRSETEKNGLVIVEAIYQLKDGEDVISWDVTIPLQFWVTTSSSLNLAATSKSQLLGFFDLTDQRKAAKAKTITTAEAAPSSSRSSNPWWKDTINDLFDLKLPLSRNNATSSAPERADDGGNPAVPTLSVKYEFKGESYIIRVSDKDELQLPNPKAKRVSSITKE